MTPDPIAEVKHSTPIHQQIAENGLIYRTVAGSTLLGLNVEGSDTDYMGVCIEPPEYTLGLRQFEQYVGRSQPVGVRSTDEDTDEVIYSLRKFCRLALGGNPTILLLLYSPLSKEFSWFQPFQNGAYLFASRKAGKAFLGYMESQRQRMLGERGQMRVHRPELVEQFGYDVKYASHIMRLGLQGVEFLSKGIITIPFEEEDRQRILAIRTGQVDFNDALTQMGELEAEIKSLLDTSPLDIEPDYDRVNEMLVETYCHFYESRGWV